MKIDGQCHCGQIAYEAELDPDKVGICHCNDCQALSATAFRTFAIVSGETFRFTRGQPKKYIKIAESGNRRVQAFCPNCGSAIYASGDAECPAVYNVRLGTARQRHQIVPKFELWLDSALPWLPENAQTKKFDRAPQ